MSNNAFTKTGDITITNSPFSINQNISDYKPWEDCTLEELNHGKSLHQKLLNEEKRKRIKGVKPLMIIGGSFFLFTFIGQQFQEYLHPLVLGFTALGAIASLAMAGKAFGHKSEFQERQEQTLKKINFLIRERSTKV